MEDAQEEECEECNCYEMMWQVLKTYEVTKELSGGRSFHLSIIHNKNKNNKQAGMTRWGQIRSVSY